MKDKTEIILTSFKKDIIRLRKKGYKIDENKSCLSYHRLTDEEERLRPFWVFKGGDENRLIIYINLYNEETKERKNLVYKELMSEEEVLGLTASGLLDKIINIK